MATTADVIVVGAGVQGASLAFHLALRGARVVVLERGTVAAGATGRSSGFVRMHYDLESEVRLAAVSHPYFLNWLGHVGAGDCEFVRTGFVQIVPEALEPALRANVAMQQRVGVDTRLIAPSDLEALMPGIRADDFTVAAYEPASGYADPSGTAGGFIAAARAHGAQFVGGCSVQSVTVETNRVTGVSTSRGEFSAPVVVDAAGAWSATLAATVGVEVPLEPWRHETAYFGLPDGRSARFPIVIDTPNDVYFRPEGRDLMLVGLEVASEIGGSPDRPERAIGQSVVELMASRVCERVPWMAGGTYRTGHDGQDGITPDERPVLGPAGPDGFFLACGFSGTGFKTAPGVGLAMSEWILDGRPTTVDITPYGLERFAEGRHLVGEHPYGTFWR
ncbi:MAG: FAD-binding oxidoreductase [Chloroflexi bacterium]|nr:FAD-binding oxidoreductase [Chloroflexota bacterium]